MSSNGTCVDMNAELWNDWSTRPFTICIFAFLYTTIILIGITGNLCVILAISRTRMLQTVPNLFIFSLSCSDVVVCCTSATITPIAAFKKKWIFGATLCSIAPFIAGTSLCFSTFTLSAISVDRFLLIYFPAKKALSKPQALVIIIIICTLSASLSAPAILKQQLKTFGNYCGQFCTEDWGGDQSGRRVYGSIMLSVQFLVPLLIITICYTAVSLKLGKGIILRSRMQQRNWHIEMTDQQRAAAKRRQRTNRMLIGMVVAFSASWCSSVLFNVLRDYDCLPEWCRAQEYFFGIVTHCIAMSSTVWNPLLYAALNLQLRAAFLKLLPDCLRQQNLQESFNNCKPLLQRRNTTRHEFVRNKTTDSGNKKTQTSSGHSVVLHNQQFGRPPKVSELGT